MAIRPNYPTKACPNCGQLIHARLHSHDCGWVMGDAARAGSKGKKRARKATVNGGPTRMEAITYSELEAVKRLVDSIGAEKVQQLARVFAK